MDDINPYKTRSEYEPQRERKPHWVWRKWRSSTVTVLPFWLLLVVLAIVSRLETMLHSTTEIQRPSVSGYIQVPRMPKAHGIGLQCPIRESSCAPCSSSNSRIDATGCSPMCGYPIGIRDSRFA